ncbi:stage II sporulation protein R [Tuberibacillus calidus]|uniref:stage II sporulation protein R n=1 Tax=Tuberibacillus calidus TaxID=340097 RepID=UPI00042A5BE7|nr:stage II sporulation protein R [Tuberibacillus calidus]
MKQKVILSTLLSLFILMIFMEVTQNLSKAENHADKIPDDAIRLRILANSNSASDQAVKRKIRDAVNANVEQWVGELRSVDQAKRVIRSHLDDLRAIVARELKAMGINEPFTVKLGKADFPTKMYGGYVYPAGKYEALVITLGEGKGANWWCVLFPPLCFLDFDNGDAVKPDAHGEPAKPHHVEASQKQNDDVKVRFFLVDLFEGIVKFFKSLVD